MKTEFNHAANEPRSGSTKKEGLAGRVGRNRCCGGGLDGLVHDARMSACQPMFERMKTASVGEAAFLLAVQ
jgi:hypothetical protein